MRELRGLILTVVLAVVAAAAGAWAGSHWALKRDAGSASLHAMVHDGLDITEAQDRKLDEIESRFSARRAVLEADLRKANAELALAIRASRGDSAEVQAAIDHLHVAMGALQKETVRHVFEMRAVLTPAQAEIFDARVAESLTQEGK